MTASVAVLDNAASSDATEPQPASGRVIARERAARRAAEEAIQRRDELLAAVSHDLQSPLAAIQGRAQLLRRRLNRGEPVSPDYLQKALSSIESVVQSMSAQIQELLDATRMQAGQPLRLRRTPTDLVALAQAVLAAQAESAEPCPIHFEPAVLTLSGLCDAPRMRRVFSNLLSNAVKYSPLGGEVRLLLAREERSDGAWAVITVQDRGIGIPPEELPHIFEPFRRGRNADGVFDGIGLGLASVRRIVDLHGGSISVESHEGVGSTFTVHLPLVDVAEQTAPDDVRAVAADLFVSSFL